MSGIEVNIFKDPSMDITQIQVSFKIAVAIPNSSIASTDEVEMKKHVIDMLLKEAEGKLTEQLGVKDDPQPPSKYHVGGVVQEPPPNTGGQMSEVIDFLTEHFNCLDTPVQCPKCITYSDLDIVIMHLNDVHSWSREEIADWLETLDIDIRMKEVTDS